MKQSDMTPNHESISDIEFEALKDRIKMYWELYQKNQERYKRQTGQEYKWVK